MNFVNLLIDYIIIINIVLLIFLLMFNYILNRFYIGLFFL